MELNDLLRRAVDAGASDIHLKLDRPPMLRRDGSVAPLEGVEPLTEADLDAYLRTVTAIAPQRYDLYHESGDLDIAYTAGDLPRFRVNAFRQRGAIQLRTTRDPEERAAVRGPRPAGRDSRARRGASRPRARDRRNRLGQDDDARRDDRLHQPRATVAHRHDRGPDRDPAPGSPVDRQPARDRARHRELRPGAPARASPGSGHDPDRRAARRRDGADRAAGGRVGPPRLLDAPHGRRSRDDRPHDRVLPRGQADADPVDHGRRPARRRFASASCRASAAAALQQSR